MPLVPIRSTIPPTLRQPRLILEELHLLSAIPMNLLEGYEVGLFKPAQPEAHVLMRVAALLYKEGSALVAMRVDLQRFVLLRDILPLVDVQKLKDSKTPELYHKRLLELCEANRDALELAIVKKGRERFSYDAETRR